MALSNTTLVSAVTASQLSGFPLTSGTGFPAVAVVGSRQLVLIDSEYMLVDQMVTTTSMNVLQRGYNGSVAVAHAALAPVVTSSTATDFSTQPIGLAVRPLYADQIVTIGVNGAIPVPAGVQPTTVNLAKATALSSTTLAAPGADQDGLKLTITSTTAAAHVITATSLINDGVTGEPHTTLTFAAFAGASIVLEAMNALWNVVSNNNVTVS